MSTPNCLVRSSDGAALALRNMKLSGVSSAYVTNDKLGFEGIITLDAAIKVLSGYTTFELAIIRDIPVVSNCNAKISDIMDISAKTPFPLPVLDDNGLFCGIVTKASVISSMIQS